MFDPAEIQQLMLDEIELLTAMCRGRKFLRPMEVQQDTLAVTLEIAAGREPDQEKIAA